LDLPKRRPEALEVVTASLTLHPGLLQPRCDGTADVPTLSTMGRILWPFDDDTDVISELTTDRPRKKQEWHIKCIQSSGLTMKLKMKDLKIKDDKEEDS
jgi:hypothetical protein